MKQLKYQDLIDDDYKIINSSPTTTILSKYGGKPVIVDDLTDDVFELKPNSYYAKLGKRIKNKEELIKYVTR